MTRLAFSLMLQALAGKLIPPEPARPGPSRLHLWRGEDAVEVSTLDVGHRISRNMGITPGPSKLTEVDAEVDEANAGEDGAIVEQAALARADVVIEPHRDIRRLLDLVSNLMDQLPK